jgi:hypothetical protein
MTSTRAAKVRAAMDGIRRGEHLPDARLESFIAMQREENVIASRELSANDRVIASAEWSRQLREKLAESQRRERHQVLVDLQDEP